MPTPLSFFQRGLTTLWLFLFLALAVLAAGLGLDRWDAWRTLDAQERQHLLLESNGVAENLGSRLQTTSDALAALRADLPWLLSKTDGLDRLNWRLAARVASTEGLRTLLVVDAQGRVFASNREELIGTDFHNQERYRTMSGDANPERLYISAPFKTPLGLWSVSLGRVVVDDQGRFNGYVLAILNPDYFHLLLSTTLDAPDMRAAVIHADGLVVYRTPDPEGLTGQDLHARPQSLYRRFLDSGADQAVLEGLSASGDQRLMALQIIRPGRTPADKPLVVAISRARSAVFAPWRQETWVRLGFFALIALIATFGLRAYQRRQQAEARWRLAAETERAQDAERLHLATDGAELGVWYWDLATETLNWSERCKVHLALPPGVAPSFEHFYQVMHPDDRPRIEALIDQAVAARSDYAAEYRVRWTDGSEHWITAPGRVYTHPDGSLRGMGGITQDITPRKQAERQLQESESRFRTLFEESQQASLLLEDGRFSAVNQAALRMLRLERPEPLLGRSLAELSPSQQPDGSSSAEKAAELTRLAHAQGTCTFEWQFLRADGEAFPILVVATVIRHQGKDLLHNVWQDLTEQKQALERINYLVYHDALTGLPNRVLGQDHLGHALAAVSRHHAGLAVLYLDLDKFNYLNDTYGHAVGDRLLQAVAQRLARELRAEDRLCRLSGDEFMLILTDLPATEPLTPIMVICERLQAQLAEPFDFGSLQLFTSCAIGVAVYPQDGHDGETLMRHADTALHAAKQAGGHGYRLFEPHMNQAVTRYVQIRDALEQHQFELHYQPQIDLRSGRTVGVEALIRCQNPGSDLLLPADFIGAAEESGLILPIGRWVLTEACRQTAAWHAAGWRDLTVAVNLSAVQFRHPRIMTEVFDALTASGLAPEHLELELTESLLLQNEAIVQQTVRGWKARGIKLAIDDFGTGYSSLAYLKHFKVDKLKIDRSFILDIRQDEEARAIVQAMIQMARSLNLRTIAEGVEEAAMAEQLQVMGCDEAQGYLYAKPLRAEDLFRWQQGRHPDPPAHTGGERREDRVGHEG